MPCSWPIALLGMLPGQATVLLLQWLSAATAASDINGNEMREVTADHFHQLQLLPVCSASVLVHGHLERCLLVFEGCRQAECMISQWPVGHRLCQARLSSIGEQDRSRALHNLLISGSIQGVPRHHLYLPCPMQGEIHLYWVHRESARREAQAEHKADVLAEENASLVLELDCRPTAKQYKSLQHQMDILERRLNETKHAQE